MVSILYICIRHLVFEHCIVPYELSMQEANKSHRLCRYLAFHVGYGFRECLFDHELDISKVCFKVILYISMARRSTSLGKTIREGEPTHHRFPTRLTTALSEAVTPSISCSSGKSIQHRPFQSTILALFASSQLSFIHLFFHQHQLQRIVDILSIDNSIHL